MKLLKIFFIALACTLSHSILAISSVDIRLEHETWNTGINGKTTAHMLGLGGTHSFNRSWLFADNFIIGKHDDSTTSHYMSSSLSGGILLSFF